MGRHIVRTDFIFQRKKREFYFGLWVFFFSMLTGCFGFYFQNWSLPLLFAFFFYQNFFFFFNFWGFPHSPPSFFRNALSLSTVGFLLGKAASYVSWFSALLNWNMFLCALRAHSFGGSTKDKIFHASFLKPISDSPLKPIQNSP